jgi:DHA1 family bicyclomycin/chloramphenicol resistance-like MFS transporter
MVRGIVRAKYRGPKGQPVSTGIAEEPAVAPPRGRDGTVLVALLAFMTAVGPLSLDMYLPAFPEIADGFGVSPAQVQLSLTTCLIGLAVGQLVFGPLSDRWGRRRPVIIGLAAYAAFSLLCAFAPSAPALAGLRLVQGVAGGVGVVIARAVVRDLYSGVAAAKYFSRLALIFGIAPIAAPSLGSAVLLMTSWRGVFVALGVIGVLLTLLVVWKLPETLPAGRRSTGGLADTWATARTLAADRVYLGYALAQGFAFAGLFAYISGSSFVLQAGYGVPGPIFSLLFGINAAGLIALSQVNRWLLDHRPPRTLLIGTLVAGVAAASGLLAATLLGLLGGVVVTLFVFLSTVGMVMPNATALALDRHPRRAGTAAALMGGIQSVIGAIAAPLVGIGEPGHGVPMAVVVLCFACAALLAVLVLARERPRRGPVAAAR